MGFEDLESYRKNEAVFGSVCDVDGDDHDDSFGAWTGVEGLALLAYMVPPPLSK